ncbi:MAG: U32 family peptidase [Bacillota bacterium]|jgi:putative protease|nr:U32 family peptidase [Bacillota bacterium]HHU43505.1 U32 family peptidase [Clostridiales bacterium]
MRNLETKVELLAPAGNIKKLRNALHFGADAVYGGGKRMGLRAFADNFEPEELSLAAALCHEKNKKFYITVNIFAQNQDFGYLKEYLQILDQAKVDALIVSDAGVVSFIKKHLPNMDIHLSTQANTTNKYAVSFWKDIGIKRVILAREMSLDEIRETADFVNGDVELEVFIHGAMCVAYSGRCLLSSYLTDRDSNRGECVQACRWQYKFTEATRPNKKLTLEEDERGSYILNSKDLCAMPFIDKIVQTGVSSLKIEGRMKSEYYVATVVNAYRKRLNDIYDGKPYDLRLMEELKKIKHRDYTEGFFFGKEAGICYRTSAPRSEYDFVAEVLGYDEEKKAIIVEQRNRFYQGEELEILSPTEYDNQKLIVDRIYDKDNNIIKDCKLVQQTLYIESEIKLEKHDILRRRKA